MAAAKFQLDREKMKEAILLIASECPPERLGNVKLHKALYFADMLTFLHVGCPLTGDEYLKQKFGPTARHLSIVVNELEREGRIKVSTEEYYGMFKKNYVPTGDVKITRLSEIEIKLLKDMSEFVCGYSAKEVSEFSHNAAWEMMDPGEVIPYFTALQLVPEEITDSDRQWALESAREHAVEPFPIEVLHKAH